jgi:hypothetical protein
MSKSNPKLTNPAVKFFDFKGDTGQWFYYDKEAEERKELKMPFYFVVLDELTAIKGYNERNNCGIYSNEIRFIKDDILNVRSFKGGIQIVGKYNDIKDAALREGGKFCKSVYAMLIVGKGEYELVNFQLHGSAFGAWIEKGFNVEDFAVGVESNETGTKGKVTYKHPVFLKKKLTPDIDQEAIKMDKKLQVYLASYFNQQVEVKITEAKVVDETETYEGIDEAEIHDKLADVKSKAIQNKDDGSDDLPF